MSKKNYKKTLNSAREAVSYLKIMRSCQLDSIIIDKEIFSILKELFMKVFEVYKPSIRDKYQSEIKFFINLILYRFSILENKPTYGCKLQNLKYRNEMSHSTKLSMYNASSDLTKEQKFLYFVLKVLTPYLYEKLNEYITNNGWSEYSNKNPKKKIWKMLQSLEKLYKLSSLLNFYVFLYNGKYTSVVDRILKIRLVYDDENLNRIISNDYLSFQLVWSVLTGMKNYIKGLLKIKRINKYKDLPFNQCAICKESKGDTDTPCPIHIPYITNCGHVYCYYCIKSEMVNSSGNENKSMYMCPRCSRIVSDIEPYYHYDDDSEEEKEEEEEEGESDGEGSSSHISSEDEEMEEIDSDREDEDDEDNITSLVHRKKY